MNWADFALPRATSILSCAIGLEPRWRQRMTGLRIQAAGRMPLTLVAPHRAEAVDTKNATLANVVEPEGLRASR